jgi:hypothetical protein
MFRVAENKLGGLDGAVLQDLAQKGILGRIYAHLMSLDNFQRLLVRNDIHHQNAAAKTTATD